MNGNYLYLEGTAHHCTRRGFEIRTVNSDHSIALSINADLVEYDVPREGEPIIVEGHIEKFVSGLHYTTLSIGVDRVIRLQPQAYSG